MLNARYLFLLLVSFGFIHGIAFCQEDTYSFNLEDNDYLFIDGQEHREMRFEQLAGGEEVYLNGVRIYKFL